MFRGHYLLSAVAIGVALIFFVDWFFAARLQAYLLGSLPRALPITLLLHGALASALMLSYARPRSHVPPFLFSAIMLLSAVLALKNIGVDFSFALERRLFEGIFVLPEAKNPGLPSLQTSLGLFITASVFITLKKYRADTLQFLFHLLLILFIPYSALCGYIFRVGYLYYAPGESSHLIGISPITIVLFFLQYFTIFLQTPQNLLYQTYFSGRRWAKKLRMIQLVSTVFTLVFGGLNSIFFVQSDNADYRLIVTGAALLPLIIALFNMQLSGLMEKNEREIDRSIIALERSFAFRQKLDTMLAHDLRGPFHGLVGLSKVIASPNTPEKDMRSYAILLERETGKFLDLLNDLLRWTQRQISERNVEHQQFTPAEIFQYLERYFRADILGKSLTFRYEIMENFRIHGDWQLSTAIMRNFLSNAVKFSSPGADIAFRAVKTGNKAILAIADEGADDLEGLFFNASAAEEYVPAPIKQGEKGFGMGLQLCRDFARRLNGKISVVSGIGQGTELWFITPLDQRGDKAK